LDRSGHRTIQPPPGQQALLIPTENLALSSLLSCVSK
jgi:hypothetical protein